MELKGNAVGIFLTGFIIILLGITFTSTVGNQTASTTDLSNKVNESVTLTTKISTVFNESVTQSGSVVQLVFPGIVNVTYFGNGTNNTQDQASINFNDEVNFSRSGVLRVSGAIFDSPGPYNVTYKKDNNVTGTLANANVVGLSFFGDSNQSTHHTTIVLGSQVNFTKAGVLTLDSANFTNRAYNASYTYQGANYVVDGVSRTILSLNTLWFALFVLGAALVLVLRAYPELFNF